MPEAKDFAAEYIRKGSYHHRMSGFVKLWTERNYALLAEGVHGRVLDIACGDGRLADFLDPAVAVDGFDIVPEAVRLAHAKGRYGRVWEGDIRESAPYEGGPYDFFICSLSLQYLTQEELEGHLSHMAGLLESGGTYRFSYPNTKPEYAASKIREDTGRIFRTVRLRSICGFIDKAHDLAGKDLEEAFTRSLDTPPERSYHYIVEASQQQ